MEWIVGVLIISIVVLTSLYWKSVGEGRNFALLILLDENVQSAQRKGLIGLVQSIEARNAGELGSKVNLALDQLAAKLGGTSLGVTRLLWKLRAAPVQQAR